MQLNKKIVLSAVAVSVLMTGCQGFNDFMDHTFGKDKEQPQQSVGTPLDQVPTMPPTTQTLPAAQPSTPVAPSSLVIYLSSATPREGYTAVEQRGQLIHVDPRQTLTRADLNNVIAVQDAYGNPFLNLHFSATGTQKLSDITSRHLGQSLTVTYRNQLVSIISIDRALSGGVLPVPMHSARDASQLEQAILDGN